MHDEFWDILKGQPGVGVMIIDVDGRVAYSNAQARAIYYGNDFDPVGKTILEIEGPDFAAERMQVIRDVLATGKSHRIRHIRGGLSTEATIFPLRHRFRKPCILSITRQGMLTDSSPDLPTFESGLVDLGPLDCLTPRELEVMALIGQGMPLKSIAQQLQLSQRTVERYRTDVARKLRLNSIAEIARIVQAAGLDVDHADLPRLNRWHGERRPLP